MKIYIFMEKLTMNISMYIEFKRIFLLIPDAIKGIIAGLNRYLEWRWIAMAMLIRLRRNTRLLL